MSLKILHLLSDWKLTGPSEPVVTLCPQLQQRGHDVTLAYRKPPQAGSKSVAALARATGVNATDQFRLNHHFSFSDNPVDVIQLKRFIRQQQFQIINTNLSHDHILGGLAAHSNKLRHLICQVSKKGNIRESLYLLYHAFRLTRRVAR